MARLRAYSCPKCASFLEVDREQDSFDCSFCGSHYDAVSFHGKDLFEQAGEYIRRKEFKMALEKFDYLLSKRPEKFEYLYGYACAVGGVPSIDKYDDPKRYNVKLTALLASDPRFSEGPAGPYFQKLSEMNSLAKKRAKLVDEQRKLESRAVAESDRIYEEREYNGKAFSRFLYIHLFTGLILIFVLIRKLGILIILYYLLAPFIVYWITDRIHNSRQKKLDPYYEERLTPLNLQKHNAYEMRKEIRTLREEYDKAYSELPGLKPESAETTLPAVLKAVPKKSNSTVNTAKKVICKKCGAGLVLDREKKLYICNHCGMSYDYSVFVGNPKTKANTYHKNGEFELADKIYAQILSEDPSDFYANRGRLLCAGRWIGFIQIKLNEDLMHVNWASINQILDAAIKNSEDSDREYFIELKKLLYHAEEYSVVNAKLAGAAQTVEYDVMLERRQELVDAYPDIYRYFIQIDNRYRTYKLNDFTDRADSVFAYRIRIFELGHWNSIDEIDPLKPFVIGGLQKIKEAVEDAKDNSGDEYTDYYILWKDFLDKYGDYAVFRAGYREYGDEEKDKQLMEEIEDIKNKLIAMDNKLFYERKDSL